MKSEAHDEITQQHGIMATVVKSCILIGIIGLTMMSPVLGAVSCDSCPQCIIIRPICATFRSQYATNNRRSFLSECHMRCYNKCHGTQYYKLYEGSNCV